MDASLGAMDASLTQIMSSDDIMGAVPQDSSCLDTLNAARGVATRTSYQDLFDRWSALIREPEKLQAQALHI